MSKSKILDLQQNDSSNELVSIEALSGAARISKLESQVEFLTKQNLAYSQTVEQLLAKVEEKDNLIRHLESMLKDSVPVVGEAKPFLISDEEYILEMVIKELKDVARLRPLTKDEMTKLDLAIKNKRLIQGNATNINDSPKLDKLSVSEKLRIASKPLKEGN